MEINNPGCTYHIQFHKGFSFDAFERVIHYLEKPGVQTAYASPVFKSVPGSNHGNALAESNVTTEFVRLAYSSVAKTAVIHLQDILKPGRKLPG
jgi:hypothetical protein